MIRDETSDELFILEAAVPMVNPVDGQHVERLPDVLGRALLARVSDAMEALSSRPLEHTRELRWWVAHLCGVEANADERHVEG